MFYMHIYVLYAYVYIRGSVHKNALINLHHGKSIEQHRASLLIYA